MRIIYSVIFLFIFLLGTFLGIKGYRLSKAIYWGTERRFRAAIVDSVLYGLAASLVMFGGVYLLASIADNRYPLKISVLLMSFALFLIPGLVVFLGSLLQFLVFGLYRDRLKEFILSKRNDRDLK
jgi:ABC-type Fe3+ transport system permease subunit